MKLMWLYVIHGYISFIRTHSDEVYARYPVLSELITGDTEITCSSAEYQCLDGYSVYASSSPCVPHSWVCDGEPDCTDSSDESVCKLLLNV